MTLTVLNVSYPFATVGPDAVGGAEQMLCLIDRALCHAGHRSLVIAGEGSQTMGELVPLRPPQGPFDEYAHHLVHTQVRAAIEHTLEKQRVDVVHMHGIDFDHYLPPAPTPLLVTLHLPLNWYSEKALSLKRPNTYLHCVSPSQRLLGPSTVRLLADIPNGVHLERFAPSAEKADYALVLGRVCPEKGIHLALEAAARADVPLLIAGQVFPFPAHERYFREEILPRLDSKRRFIGPVGRAEKSSLLARARCLIVSSIVAETSSLSAMEALASGTPVIAFRRGALPDLIEHGRTGFLVDSVDELVNALGHTPSLLPSECRGTAQERFSDRVCAARYLAVYEQLAQGHTVASAPVVSTPAASAAQELAAPELAVQELAVQELRSVSELEALRDAWSSLWQRCPQATVFQRPEWLLPWCRHLLQGQLFALALWNGRELVAVFPFFRYQAADKRVLALLGAGVSDYQDALVQPAHESQALHTLRGWLWERRQEWDACEWSELAPQATLLSSGLGAQFPSELSPQEVCPALVCTESDTLLDRIPPMFYRDLAYAQRRLAREGGLCSEAADTSSFEELFAALVSTHGARRSQRSEPSSLDRPELRAFHHDAARALLSVGALLLYGIRLHGRWIATWYGFQDRTATRYYLSGFDPHYARLSLGKLTVAHAVEAAQQRGGKVFDFLRGAEPYKYRWGAQDRLRLQRRSITNGTDRGITHVHLASAPSSQNGLRAPEGEER